MQCIPNAKFVVIMRSLEGQVSSMKMHFKTKINQTIGVLFTK